MKDSNSATANAINHQLQLVDTLGLAELSETKLIEQLDGYLKEYSAYFSRSSQFQYFSSFVKGLLNDLDRKSIEPIDLTFLGETSVRSLQQFFTRFTGFEASLHSMYRQQFATILSMPEGFLCVDGSDFVKKVEHRGRCSPSVLWSPR